MSAKKTRQPASASASVSSPPPAAAAGESGSAAPVAWIDSSDPRKRQIAKILLVALWIYVGALWLLALDQWFDWGIFGPVVPKG